MLRDELVKPRSVVIVGGSNDLSKPGGTVLRNILAGGYSGRISILNTGEKTVQGLTSYNDMRELPDSECAVLAVNAESVIPTVRFLASEKNTRAFIVLSAGFSETGSHGLALEEELVSIVSSVNGTLIGPNCTGVLFPGFAATFAGPIPEFDSQGADFVSASGAFAVFTLERAIPMGIRFASVIAVGNSPQCGVEEVVKHWDESHNSRSPLIKLLYMEQIRKPDIFLRHCRSLVEKGCRIAAIKSGTTDAGSRAALSHTGALTGPDIAVDALFRKCGITRCTGREEFVYTAGVLMHGRPRGRSFAVVTHAGGPGVMAADALTKNGITVPEFTGPRAERLKGELFHGSSVSNPVDFIGTGTAAHLGKILDFIEDESPEIDASIVIFGTPGLFDVKHVYDLLDKKMSAARKPVFPVLPSTMIASEAIEHFTGLGRVFFPDEVMLAKSLGLTLNTGTPFHNSSTESAGNDCIRGIINTAGNGYLTPSCVRRLLNSACIPCANEITVLAEEEIDFALSALGFPVAMKVTGPVHKTEAGGVKLNITSNDGARAAFSELMNIPGATGVVIQEMVSGIELFIGAKREPRYGHVILCGIGGIFVETLKDLSAGITPLGTDEAVDMIRRLRGYPLIKGARGRAGVSEEIFAEIITKVSSLLISAPEIRELDINPLIGSGDVIKSVDCRIYVERN